MKFNNNNITLKQYLDSINLDTFNLSKEEFNQCKERLTLLKNQLQNIETLKLNIENAELELNKGIDRFITDYKLSDFIDNPEIKDTKLSNVSLKDVVLDNFQEITDNFNGMEQAYTNNSLLDYNCVLDERLIRYLDMGWSSESYTKRKEINMEDEFSVVMFNNIKYNGKTQLIYNKIGYNNLFKDIFMLYAYIEQMNLLATNKTKGSNYMFCIDSNLISNNFNSDWNIELNQLYKDNMKYIYNLFSERGVRFSNLIELCKYGLYMQIPLFKLDNMAKFIGDLSSVGKNNLYLIELLLKNLISYKRFNIKNIEYKDIPEGFNCVPLSGRTYNNLNRLIFVVSDFNKFLQCFKEKGYEINGGPQKFRGCINSLGYHLHSIDQDFRLSMYKHGVKHGRPINLNQFSFQNIHQNLGSVKWYSTSIVNNVSKGKTFKVNSPAFNELRNLIINNPINDNTQILIEEYLLNSSYASSDNLNNIYSVNKDLAKILIDEKDNFKGLVRNFTKSFNKDGKGDVKLNDKAKSLLADILSKVKQDFVLNIVFGRLLKVIRLYSQSHNKDDTIVNISYDLGCELINKYKYLNYLEWKENNGDIGTFSTWCEDNNKDLFTNLDKDEDSTLIFTMGSILLEWLIILDLGEIKTVSTEVKEKVNKLIPSKRLRAILDHDSTKNAIFTLPHKIPMIVKPKFYKTESVKGKTIIKLGGYLLNDVKVNEALIKKSWDSKDSSKIMENNKIYDLINNLNSIPYQINQPLLQFIFYDRPDLFKDLLVDEADYAHLIQNNKRTLKQQRELDSLLSKKELQENILGLADIFSLVPEFYIPVKLDFRGRVYCIPEYLHYQSNDLAKALLLFKRGGQLDKSNSESLTSINYLKIYGANCFGLDKKSFNDRIKWVNDNEELIANFRNNNIILEAENKFLFTAFCLEYERWLNCERNHDMATFQTYLPIQMDATCNGFQHLSLLSSDNNLASELNLDASNWSDKPKDFYTFLLNNLIEYFIDQLNNNNNLESEVKESYLRLINMDIQRKIIKKSIMTIPYNVSDYQLIKYIKENFSYSEDGWFYLNDIKLKSIDFKHLGLGLRVVLRDKFPKLASLLTYLEEIAEVCCILGIPIPWTLPSGVEIKQSYIETRSVRLKPFTYQKNTFVLKVKNSKQFDKLKQIRSFMPNLIHSLDATSLTLLVDLYFKSNPIHNIFTVHDCFAVTANQVSNIMDLLKHTYTEIYSDNEYLKKLDYNIKMFIKVHFGEDSISEDLQINPIYLEGIKNKKQKVLYLPDINKVLSKDIDFNRLNQSSYPLN